MSKPFRKFAVFFCLVGFLVALVGCQKTASDPPSSPPSPTTEIKPSPNTAAPTPSEPVTLTYYSMWNENEPQADVIRGVIEEYEETTGNTVDVVWYGRNIQVAIRNLVSSTPVDIWDKDLVRSIETSGDLMLDLTPYFDKPLDVLGGRSALDVIDPGQMAFIRRVSPDAIKGVPYQPYTVVMFYNKEQFRQAGITEPPATWEAFLEACQKLKDAGYVPLNIENIYRVLWIGYDLARRMGTDWMDQLVRDPALWQDPAVMAMCQAALELKQKGYFSPTVVSGEYPTAQREFEAGRTAMFLYGSFFVNEALGTDVASELGAFNFPTMPGGAQGNNVGMLGSQGFFISKASQHPDQAFDLISRFLSAEVDQVMTEKTNGIPMILENTWPPLLDEVRAAFDQTTEWMDWSAGLFSDFLRSNQINNEFGRMLDGEITPEEFGRSLSMG